MLKNLVYKRGSIALCTPLRTKAPTEARLSSTASNAQPPKTKFYMPPEWAKHSQTITVWPDFASIPDEAILRDARSEISAISNAIARFEPVTMYTKPQNVDKARDTVSENVTVRPLEASQLWVRDTGPIIVKNLSDDSRAGLSLSFNYWGDKLESQGDEEVASGVLKDMGVNAFTAGFRAEGGGFEVDGQGTLLATESAIINPNRNPGLSKSDIEAQFKEYLGIEKTIWLRGIKGYEMTDYHIDALARFISPGKVLLGRMPETADKVLVEAYQEARETLESATDASGNRIQIIEVAEPHPKELRGEHFFETVASYANYLLVNGGIIIPRFGVGKADDDALELFKQCFPDREVVQVDINTVPKLGGGIHCSTQQVPLI
ncbi:hypothetical protein Neosp_002890 [[Neocosmospora] mangrovei]